jgi:DNA replication factor GINS
MAPGEEMGFKFIQQVQQKESRSHNLTKLPADFFENLAIHIEGLRRLAREEMAKDPMSTTATLLSNELRNTLSLSQDIVLLRLRKMANRAVDSLEGGRVDVRALTPKEKDMYSELASFMASAHEKLAPGRGAPGSAQVPPSASMPPPSPSPASPPTSPPTSPEPEPSTPVVAAEGTEGDEGNDVEVASEPAPTVGTVMIHVLKDTPPFAGEDGQTYSLKRGDMVSLPSHLAQVLVSRGMAEEVSNAP